MSGTDGEGKQGWIKRVLSIDLPQGADGDDPLDLKNRLATASRQLKDLKAEGDPTLPLLLQLHAAAAAAFDKKSNDAGDLMDDLEHELGLALSAARGRKAGQGTTGLVAYTKLLLRWRVAQARVGENLTLLGAALLRNEEVIQDPNFEAVQEAVADLPDLVPELGGKLDDVLDAASAPGANRESLNREALSILAEYRARIGAIAALRELEPFAAQAGLGQFDLFSEFNAALDELESEITKAL